ncbi:MAG: cell division ATP-binding protein FtsE [Lachnospiraceae bacterium]|nr:cell division ATP-binding protein FtsE [Lachnospiraceae bacterium]
MIIFDNVTKMYETGTPALNGVSFKINSGEFVFIVGNSGSGKSTIIKLLTRELNSTSGRVVVNNKILGKLRRKNIAKYRRGIGVIFQDFRLLNDRNVYENVAFAQRVTGVAMSRIRRQVPAVLSVVGLAEKYKANPKHLSGGEQQRVAIARALVNNPSILLADEPTGNLDPKNTKEIMSLLEEINKKGTTVIVVTHNREVVDSMKKRVITVHKGTIVGDERRGGYK